MTGHTMTSQTPPAGEDRDRLDARYGRTPARRRRDRVIAWAGGIAVFLVFAVWVVWTVFDGPGATIDSRTTGFKVVDDRTVTISYEVSMPPGTRAACALQVQNEAHGIAGWKVVEIPASTRYTQAYSDTVRTVEQGVTGLIYRCWLP